MKLKWFLLQAVAVEHPGCDPCDWSELQVTARSAERHH